MSSHKSTTSISKNYFAWVWLLSAGAMEIAFALTASASQAFTRPLATLFCLITALLGTVFLSKALQHMQVGIGYSVLAGIGTAGTLGFGVLLFNDVLTSAHLICLLLIVSGITLLQVEKTQPSGAS